MIKEYERCRELVESRLEQYFKEDKPYGLLNEAMRYSLLAGGKRIRPVLLLEFCIAAGGQAQDCFDAACGVEMLHTYSLIHDDLPCMDNDDLRRGKPTNHKVYGECTATLAGDALQAEAFRAVLSSKLPPDRVVKMASFLAEASGSDGICGGQILDMLSEGKTIDSESMQTIHMLKTASLLQACCKMGVAAAGGSKEQIFAAERYAGEIGLAFQVADDILDETSTTETLGKPVGSDEENHKSTFVTMYGIKRCREVIARCTDNACEIVSSAFEKPEFLKWFARFLAERNY